VEVVQVERGRAGAHCVDDVTFFVDAGSAEANDVGDGVVCDDHDAVGVADHEVARSDGGVTELDRPGEPSVFDEPKGDVDHAALEMLDEEGLAKLSLKRLAAEIGVHESSIYFHYRYKANILADVLRAVLSDRVPRHEGASDWKQYLLEAAPPCFRAVAAHPQVVSILLAARPRTWACPSRSRWLPISSAGFPDEFVPPIREQLEALVLGVLQFSNDQLFEQTLPEEFRTLQRVVDA
jgi:AcrR family transcriptional regulator